MDRLEKIDGLEIYGPRDPRRRGAAIAFNLRDIHPHDVGTVLDRYGVAIRAGHHCAQPLMRCLMQPATARASFYIYNTPAEVDVLVDALREAERFFAIEPVEAAS
jgi:cysteine desulfurase/selenocysteine lyase